MIEVRITAKDGKLELARIKIENVGGDEEYGNYSVQYAVNRALGAIGMHQRGFDNFPRLRYNVLALVLQALNTLDPKELELEDGIGTADMAREVRGALPPFADEKPRADHHHRPSFWRR